MITDTAVYTDFQGLRQLEAGAKEHTPEATREAARQFEALFVQMMLKSMRDASAVLAEERDTTYEEMFDRQIALELSREKGIGIADLMMRQLGAGDDSPDPATIDQAKLHNRIATRSEPTAMSAVNAPTDGVGRDDFRPNSPEQFLEKIWPLAERAANDLGIDPRVVAAQAALETGWGQHQIRDANGVSGNNVFGIKADRRWDGEQVKVPTLEYESGVPKRTNALFRAYQNLQEGFDDYVNFLRSNPRYGDALKVGRNAIDFAVSLQRAGYATDPSYADKITGIMQSSRFSRVLDGLKLGGLMPTL